MPGLTRAGKALPKQRARAVNATNQPHHLGTHLLPSQKVPSSPEASGLKCNERGVRTRRSKHQHALLLGREAWKPWVPGLKAGLAASPSRAHTPCSWARRLGGSRAAGFFLFHVSVRYPRHNNNGAGLCCLVSRSHPGKTVAWQLLLLLSTAWAPRSSTDPQ